MEIINTVINNMEELARLLPDSIWWILSTTLYSIVALITTKIILSLLFKVVSGSSNTVDDYIFNTARSPLVYTSVLTTWYVNIIELESAIASVLLSTIITVIIIIWSLLAKRISNFFLNREIYSGNEYSIIKPQSLPLIRNLFGILIVILSTYLIFTSWNVDMSAWLASAGVIGIVVGFATKDTLGNLFSGVFILADSPYKIGDYIVMDTGERGEVTAIGIRSTRIQTRSDIELTIPNSVIAASKIKNQTGGRHSKMRIEISIGVAYGTDIDLLREELLMVAKGEKNVCDKPEPKIRFRKFGDSSLDFGLLCWVSDPSLTGLTTSNLNTTIYKVLAKNNIAIPFPQRDIHIK